MPLDYLLAQIAEGMWELQAVKIQTKPAFLWASGLYAPINCDNRMTLSHPTLRKMITIEIVRKIRILDLKPDAIVGVATGAIAQGALVADALGLPFGYVCSQKKDGNEQKFEGDFSELPEDLRVIIIEDLISTGSSSIAAAKFMEEMKYEVLLIMSQVSYNLPIAKQNFEKSGFIYDFLIDYQSLLELARERKYITASQYKTLRDWYKGPEEWSKQYVNGLKN